MLMLMLVRAFGALSCLAMLAFVGVQYNDPDGPLWMLYYAVPACWAAVIVWRPAWPTQTALRVRALWASIVLWAGLMIFYWPTMPGFWRKDVWMQEETAREGMGLMIAFAVIVAAATAAYWSRSRLEAVKSSR